MVGDICGVSAANSISKQLKFSASVRLDWKLGFVIISSGVIVDNLVRICKKMFKIIFNNFNISQSLLRKSSQ